MKSTPTLARFNREVMLNGIPLVIAVTLLGMFTIPNYLRAKEWRREASSLRAVANEAAARQDSLLEVQRDVERLRNELSQRGRTLPNSPDQGAVLGSISRAADNKGVLASQSKSSKIAPMNVPGLPGGKAMRRSVDVEMSGTFEALFNAVSTTESLRSLVAVRAIEFSRNPSLDVGTNALQAKFSFDEYFSERAADARTVAASTRKAGS